MLTSQQTGVASLLPLTPPSSAWDVFMTPECSLQSFTSSMVQTPGHMSFVVVWGFFPYFIELLSLAIIQTFYLVSTAWGLLSFKQASLE